MMPDTTPSSPASAALDEIKERARVAADDKQDGVALWIGALGASQEDVPRLVAAIEAVLAPHQPGRVQILGHLCKHHENHRYFSITSTEADHVRACPDCTATVYTSCAGCGIGMSVDECPVREAITRELAKGETGDGG